MIFLRRFSPDRSCCRTRFDRANRHITRHRQATTSLIVDTANKFLYLIEGGGRALRYGIGVGRSGFLWAGVKTVTAKREWPGWRPTG
jgi:lipoprotein-anchoring transpeptidase ErfK/SrfK